MTGVGDHDTADARGKRTDYGFRYSQRFFDNRFQIVLDDKVPTGAQAISSAESFIDSISLEYRLGTPRTRRVHLSRDKNYESMLEGEITRTGIGLVLCKRVDRLSELFTSRKKKKASSDTQKTSSTGRVHR